MAIYFDKKNPTIFFKRKHEMTAKNLTSKRIQKRENLKMSSLCCFASVFKAVGSKAIILLFQTTYRKVSSSKNSVCLWYLWKLAVCRLKWPNHCPPIEESNITLSPFSIYALCYVKLIQNICQINLLAQLCSPVTAGCCAGCELYM